MSKTGVVLRDIAPRVRQVKMVSMITELKPHGYLKCILCMKKGGCFD